MPDLRLKTQLSITVTRANGRVDRIGIIRGGTWWQHLVARIRLWRANRRVRRGGK